MLHPRLGVHRLIMFLIIVRRLASQDVEKQTSDSLRMLVVTLRVGPSGAASLGRNFPSHLRHLSDAKAADVVLVGLQVPCLV